MRFIILPLAFFSILFFTLSSNTDSDIIEMDFATEYISDGFDYPIGIPDGFGYYNAQPFGKNDHLGDDWNATTGGNTDLGDPVYAVSNGYVKFAEDVKGGWGNVIRMLHRLPDGTMVESLYAHCDTLLIKVNTWVKRGDQIGTVGTAHGKYYAHLHFEIRSNIMLEIGGGYSSDQRGYLDPTMFIKKHRTLK